MLDGVDAGHVLDLAAAFAAAELVGVAQWCVDTAAEYAKERVQFGRPIGQFQGVKHKCADMLCRVELARAAAWDAARAVDDGDEAASFTAAAAIALALDAAFDERQGLRPGARRHRVHVGARRAHVPEARDGDAEPARAVVARRGRALRSSRSAARAAA